MYFLSHNLLTSFVEQTVLLPNIKPGFFIDDDLLYEDLLVSTEDDEPVVDDDSDSSWGSEEFDDDYSEDSGDEQIVSSYVENGDHTPRGTVDRANGGQRSMVTSYGIEKHGGKEEVKVRVIVCSVGA